MSSITLNAAVVVSVRRALYGALGERLDAVNTALWQPGREESCATRDAYRNLAVVAGLLDRAGWTGQDATGTLTLSVPGETQLILAVLAVQLEVETDHANSARECGEHEQLLDAEQRWEKLHDALCVLQAAAGSLGKEGGRGA